MDKPYSRMDQLFEEVKIQRGLINSSYEIIGELNEFKEDAILRMDKLEKTICAIKKQKLKK